MVRDRINIHSEIVSQRIRGTKACERVKQDPDQIQRDYDVAGVA